MMAYSLVPSNGEVACYSDEEDEEEIEEEVEEMPDDCNENQIEKLNTITKVGKLDLKQCKDALLGNKSVYHGKVKVRNVLKFSVPPDYQPGTTGTAFRNVPDNNLGFVSPINYFRTALSNENLSIPGSGSENTSDYSQRNTEDVEPNGNSIVHSEELQNPTEDVNDTTPLIGFNTENTHKGKGKYILCFTAVIFIFACLAVIYIEVINNGTNPSDSDDLPMNFTDRLITRGEWFAQPPKTDMEPFKYKPVPFLVVCHTATQPCYDKSTCRVSVRNIQAWQMQVNFYDISYNYLVGGDGYIYEGRGWDEASGGVRSMKCSALSIGFIGNFIVNTPPKKQMDAFSLILEEAVNLNKLEGNYKMFMQKQFMNTESPGEALISILIKWSHWKPYGKEDILCGNNETSSIIS